MAKFTKQVNYKPTLVSTGVKCKLDPNTFLQLSVRSSSPLKYWLMMANGVGIIDADYYNNPDNEGEIFLQIYNLSPFNIQIKKGETIGQGIILPYLTTADDIADGVRAGGFGSTDE
jgi:dUTP pyrophosphatase